jgi:hypothetical protein
MVMMVNLEEIFNGTMSGELPDFSAEAGEV